MANMAAIFSAFSEMFLGWLSMGGWHFWHLIGQVAAPEQSSANATPPKDSSYDPAFSMFQKDIQ